MDNSLFSYYTNAYLPSVRHRSQNWRAQIAWAMDKHVLPVFGGADIECLTRKDLQAHFNGLLGSMKATSVRKVLIVLSGILNLAIADEVIQKNPASTLRLPAGDPPNKRALSMEQLWKLYEAASDRARPVIILGGFCGLRIGEVCGVQRNHIDTSGVLEVQQQALQPKGGCTLTGTLKTPQSRRPIPLPTKMLEVLMACNQVSGVFLTSDSKGGYLTPNNATRELAAAAEFAKIGKVSPHELRHTFISLMENEIEAPRSVVEELAGKAKDSRNGVYSKARIEQKRRWMDRLWDQTSTSVTTVLTTKQA